MVSVMIIIAVGFMLMMLGIIAIPKQQHCKRLIRQHTGGQTPRNADRSKERQRETGRYGHT